MSAAKTSVADSGTSIELFSGGGGLAMALHAAGFRHLLLNERDRRACASLRANRAVDVVADEAIAVELEAAAEPEPAMPEPETETAPPQQAAPEAVAPEPTSPPEPEQAPEKPLATGEITAPPEKPKRGWWRLGR